MPRPNPIECVNIVDVESTCWKGDPPEGQRSEIIEIGITQVNLFYPEISHSLQWRVRPKRSDVSPFCTELTGLTQEILNDQGVTFDAACEGMRDAFDTRERVWVSWGDYDRKMFDYQCTAFVVPYPFGPRHLNLKTLCAILYRTKEEYGMAQMLEYLGMKLEGTHHSAGDDAKNIARIFLRVVETFNIGVIESGPIGER